MCGRQFKTVLKHPPVFTHFSAQTKAPTLVGDSYYKLLRLKKDYLLVGVRLRNRVRGQALSAFLVRVVHVLFSRYI